MNYLNLGVVVRDLLPNLEQKNPRNSEGAFISLDNGDILYIYSKYKGVSSADDARADLCMLRSKDGGKTFGEDKIILTCEGEDAVNMMSLSLMRMNNGDIGLFYLIRPNLTTLQMYLRRSSDGGETWGERVLCTPEKGYYVVNNDRVTRLTNGRIIIPAASHNVCDSFYDMHSDTLFFYSDDDGVTWKRSKSKLSIQSANCESGLQEPGVIELQPNHLWAWARTDLGRQYEAFSFDNGETWTACQPSRFTSPCSPMSMKRDAEGILYAIWNPIPEYNGRTKGKVFTGGRTPYVIAKSTDNGKTFSDPVAFEDEEGRGYCYCAMYFTEDALLLAYCAGGEVDGSCLAKTRIRRVGITQLIQLRDK